MVRQILILSANPAYAGAMRQRLVQHVVPEARVDIETDAVRALQLEAAHYQLVLADAALGSVDGVQLVEMLRARAPEARFVLVSDLPPETFCFLTPGASALDCVMRPTSEKEWATALERLRQWCGVAQPEHSALASNAQAIDLRQTLERECAAGASCILHLETGQPGKTADIFLYQGEIYHAQYPGHSGAAALAEILEWQSKLDLTLYSQRHPLRQIPPRTIETPWLELLHGARAATAPDTGVSTVESRPPAIKPQAADSVAQDAPPHVATSTVPGSQPATASAAVPSAAPPVSTLARWWRVDASGNLTEAYQVPDRARAAQLTSMLAKTLGQAATLLDSGYPRQIRLLGAQTQHVLVFSANSIRQGAFAAGPSTTQELNDFAAWCQAQPL